MLYCVLSGDILHLVVPLLMVDQLLQEVITSSLYSKVMIFCLFFILKSVNNTWGNVFAL